MPRRPSPYALPTEKRKRLSKKRRAQLFLDRKGRCHRCRAKIAAGSRWIAEHFISLECGGSNEWSNWDLTCLACFHPKNREDRKKASKGRRLREGNAIHAQRMTEKLIPIDVTGAMADTPADWTLAAAAKRFGYRLPKTKRRAARPMPGSRASGWKKKLNGKTARR